MIKLIDTSLWIDFMRGGEAAQPDVAKSLREGSAAMTEPVWAELWSGSRSRHEDDLLDTALRFDKLASGFPS